MRRIVSYPDIAEAASDALGGPLGVARMDAFLKFLDELRRPGESLLDTAERALLFAALASNCGSQTLAAERIGISKRVTNYHTRRLGLPRVGNGGPRKGTEYR